MIWKLHHYGIRGLINTWFSSHLLCRTQTTQIVCTVFNDETIVCGVSQGYVLSPLFFLIYHNDMHPSFNKLDFYSFADDTILLHADKHKKILSSLLMKNCYICVNGKIPRTYLLTQLNLSSLFFSPYQNKLADDVTLAIFDNNSKQLVFLIRKTYAKYLGVLTLKAPLYTFNHLPIAGRTSYGLVAWGQALNTHLSFYKCWLCVECIWQIINPILFLYL